ncbi:flagellar basal body rod protein FlgB [Dyella tabacisoli]|uniref:Flagellar basal body rod protein N-terminal domain-containing protein n=1 Tax=Dyella tabacisoli TaxID=2282381 RepID=A0A369UKX9_9GAMM|nr:flagellar basal body protein [Dyella tabacisoli]RDD81422.1 hypothetical protein DVJ77_11965 [Dyella tabacisoli]
MDLTTEALRLGMSMARVRADVASDNIANVDVAGYRAKRADFAQAVGLLREVAAQPSMSSERLERMTPTVLRESVGLEHSATNASASLDAEVAELETASVDFQSLTTIMSRRFSLMQLALAGRN